MPSEITPEKLRDAAEAFELSSQTAVAVDGVFTPASCLLRAAADRIEELERAVAWLAHNAPGTPVPDWVDRAVNRLPSPPEVKR